MLDSIREFYQLTKLDSVVGQAAPDAEATEPPITSVKVFHKQYPRLPKTPLPDPVAEGEFAELLASRRSERHFGDESLALDELAGVLHSCRIVDADRQTERRTYPSGGARFPVEIYVIAFRVDGLSPGCYHYSMVSNELETLWERDLSEQAAEFVTASVIRPAAAIVFTSVMARAELKYGPRAFPLALIESGHMAQNMTLLCAKEDVACCPILGFVNDAVRRALDLTADEIPLYTIAIGKTTS